jgi:hypothetical protein
MCFKNVNGKKHSPEMIFINGKKVRKIWMIFDNESQIWTLFDALFETQRKSNYKGIFLKLFSAKITPT